MSSSGNPGFGKAFPMELGKKPNFGKTFSMNKNNDLSEAYRLGNYKIGDTVKHIKFGIGVVTDIEPMGSDSQVTVDFERVGSKTLFASLAKLKKI